jgi:outer membrane protein W
MKKILGLIVVISFTLVSISNAQEKGQIRAGAGLALGTQAAISDAGDEKLGVGLTFGGDYFVTDIISISPAYTFFFKSSFSAQGVEASLSTAALDFDGKYFFIKNGVNVYGLFGLSIGFATAKTTVDFGGGPTTISASDNKFGVNIGGGVDYYLSDKLFLNGQLKYNTPLSQLAINLGVGFNVN